MAKPDGSQFVGSVIPAVVSTLALCATTPITFADGFATYIVSLESKTMFSPPLPETDGAATTVVSEPPEGATESIEPAALMM